MAGLARMNVQVGAPSTFPQGDPASSQENQAPYYGGLRQVKEGIDTHLTTVEFSLRLLQLRYCFCVFFWFFR